MRSMRLLAIALLLAAVAALAVDARPALDALITGAWQDLTVPAFSTIGDVLGHLHRLSPPAVLELLEAAARYLGWNSPTVPPSILAVPVGLALAGTAVPLLALGRIGSHKARGELGSAAAKPQVDEPKDAVAAPPSAQTPAVARQRPQAGDREFLPAALEILDTPLSPIRTAFLWFICIAVVSALTWSYLGWLDIHAVAAGKIQPSGRSKVVQPLEPGKIVGVFVENGTTVGVGDVVLELDPTETTADRNSLARELEATEAELVRRKTAIASAALDTTELPAIPFAADTHASLVLRESSVLAADLGQIRGLRTTLRAQLDERSAQKERLTMSIQARSDLVAVLKERVDMRTTLREKEVGSRAAVIDALQEYQKEYTALSTDRGQLLETAAGARSLERRIAQSATDFIADQAQKLAEAERRRDRILQELIKARSKNERTRLTAPIAGTVQQLAVTTVGQVVTTGQPLLTIVPQNATIEIEAMILNQDIGFVEPGQEVVIKVEAFPFTRYGTVEGTVVKVSRDAVDERESGLGDAASVARPQTSGSASSRTQNLVFPATISLKQRTMWIDRREVLLSPGMAVTIEIKTGHRRVIDYLLSPLREVTSTSGRER